MFSSNRPTTESQPLDDIRGQFRTMLDQARDTTLKVTDEQSEALRIAFILKHLRNLGTSAQAR
jgi:hypothetical protein